MAKNDEALINAIFQKAFGLTDAQMAEGAERGRTRDAERAKALGFIRSPFMPRWPINEHSTMNHVQQGTAR